MDSIQQNMTSVDQSLTGDVTQKVGTSAKLDMALKNVSEGPRTPDKKKECAVSDLEKRYEDCLNKIFSWAIYRKKEAKDRKELNLDQMVEFARMFGDPHKGNFKIVHVAGTNGKGSVSLKTATALQAMGFKTGLFTSPHISTFRERIQINGQFCSMESMVETCELIFKEVERTDIDVRFFEVVTMIGFIEFKKAGCDYVVLECGLGAALDATNIVGLPEVVCSTITSIGKDHMDVLGNSLEEIAQEKAGIIKTGIPCVVGPSCVSADLVSIKQKAKEQNVELYQVPVMNSFIQENNAIANQIIKTVCEYENLQYDDNLQKLVGQSAQPCRFEQIINRKETIILDVCHNIDGFRAVIQQIKTELPCVKKVQIVFGISKSKKLDDILTFLDSEELVTDLYLVSRPHMRLYSPAVAHKMVSEIGSKKLRDLVAYNDVITTQSDSNSEGKASSNISSYDQNINNNIGTTLDFILKEQQNIQQLNQEAGDDNQPKQMILICGSFFIMQDVRQYFGYKQDVDYE